MQNILGTNRPGLSLTHLVVSAVSAPQNSPHKRIAEEQGNVVNNPLHLSLFELYTAFRNGNLTAGDLTEQAIAKHNSTLGAYKYWQPQDARSAAARADASFSAGEDHGLLQGIPVSVKDLYNVDGLQTFAGSPVSIPDTLMAQGPVITGLDEQQAVFIGKTHTVEFAFGGLGVNNHWGTPRNPWDSTAYRVPGGSSSGAGVSLQEGTALLALGSDTAGSVRIPASMTGNVGLKTSFGRWSLEGIFPLSPTLDTAGILTRTVADAVFSFAAMDPEHQGRALKFVDQASHCTTGDFVIGRGESVLWEECDSGIVESVETALDELSQKGVRVTDARLPEVGDAIELLKAGNVTAAEIHEFLSSKMPEWLEMLDPLVSQRILGGASMSATEYLKRRRHINQLQLSANARFESNDVIVSPTVPITPPKLDDVQQVDRYRPLNLMSLRNTCSGNTLGLCSLTLPVGLDTAGLPVGLQIMARHGAEEKLLAIALCIEKVIGTSKDRLGTPAIPPL
ncbi:MAG TPA: amidase [Gammaproteobacteria bacterium]|nr:2-amino-5-chloromuconate deaminase [Gammaproteobacteria bacterium]HIN42718.1 amidase [Gammaproteobacteria bacterium]HIP03660.1 amidase [Gammaproteobacteria bacterium]